MRLISCKYASNLRNLYCQWTHTTLLLKLRGDNTDEKRFCRFCGEHLPADAIFCTNCGRASTTQSQSSQDAPPTAQQSYQYQPNVMVPPRKNPGVAAVLSFLWTGAGQIYNGQIALGLGLILFQIFNVLLMFVLIGFITFPLTWIIGIYQAYSAAKDYNRRQGYPE